MRGMRFYCTELQCLFLEWHRSIQ